LNFFPPGIRTAGYGLWIAVLACTVGFGKNGDGENQVILEFLMNVDRDVYEMTDFGEPPQIAVWLESHDKKKMRTVWVARRSGRRLWKGKFECPTALPLWESRHKNERSSYKERGLLKRLVDAISGATPKGGVFKTRVVIREGTGWHCFVEINLSGDFNRNFPYRDKNGMPDPHINGQPSLIYSGSIQAVPGRKRDLRLVGRTDQWVPVGHIISDLDGITTARHAVTEIRVVCKTGK
jgi:hypothetical protein